MLVSTKGRYALRMMIGIVRCTDLQHDRKHVSLRIIAEAEGISTKYLEQLARPLVKQGLLSSVRGQGGGYMLTRPAAEISAADILRAVEGPTIAVPCIADGVEGCDRKDRCSTLSFWKNMHRIVEDYASSVSLADLAYPEKAAPESE